MTARLDDLTITITGDPRSRAATNMRSLIELAVVGLGGECKTDGARVSAFMLHDAHVLIRQNPRIEKKKKRSRA